MVVVVLVEMSQVVEMSTEVEVCRLKHQFNDVRNHVLRNAVHQMNNHMKCVVQYTLNIHQNRHDNWTEVC